MRLSVLLFMLLVFTNASLPVSAQVPVQSDGSLLLGSNSNNSSLFGFSLAISGDLAIVGAIDNNEVLAGAGAAYIFRRVAGEWVEEQQLVNPLSSFNDQFGFRVAIHGNVAAVIKTTQTNSATLHIFRFDGTTWVQEQTIFNSGPAYGHALALHENTIVVGDFLAGPFSGGLPSGSVYVYEWSGTTWSQVQSFTESGLYGISVDLDADTLVVGASGQSNVHVYTRNGSTFTSQQVLTASDAGPFWGFGASVSLDSDVLFVGALGADDPIPDAGAVYVFEREGSTWSEEQILTLDQAAPQGGFGLVLDVSGPYAVIGAYGGIGCDGATESYLFAKAGTDWQYARRLIAPGSEPLNSMNRTVAITDEQVWIGAHCAGPMLPGPGSMGPGTAFIYELEKPFSRGDCNQDERLDIADAITTLMWLFGPKLIVCQDACDSNDDGAVDIADPVELLSYIYVTFPPLPEPFGGCGKDGTVDFLTCESNSYCN